MDLDPRLRDAVRRIVGALHAYAAGRGWKYASHRDWSTGDYFIDVVVNDEWVRFSVTFASKGFRGEDGYDRFDRVQDWLEETLSDDPALIEAIDLVVMDDEEYRSAGGSSWGLGDVPVDEDFVEVG